MKELVMLVVVCGTLFWLAVTVLLAMPHSKLREFLMPIVAWCFALCCGAYIISPIDVLPDVVPVVGWVDDVGALFAGISAVRTALSAKKAAGKQTP